MDRRRIGYGVFALAVLAVVVSVALSGGAVTLLFGDGYDPNAEGDTGYDRTTVAVVDGETGAELGSVEAAVADTFGKRYLGLSGTDSLPENGGMLFVHDESAEYTYVMRGMSFGIDIVFAAPNGTITTIHEAPTPAPGEDGSDRAYTGDGRYVLEVNRGWTADRGVEVGDELVFEV